MSALFAFFQVFEQDLLMVCLCLRTSLWFICAPNVTQTLRQKREALGGNPSISSKAGLGLYLLKRANSALVLVGWGKEDGECHSFGKWIEVCSSLPQVLLLLLSSAFPLGLMSLILCAGMEFPDYQLFALLCVCFSTQALCWREALEGFPGRNKFCVPNLSFSWHLCLRNELSDWVE